MMWTAVDEVDTELCIRSYKGIFGTQITDDTMYCYNSAAVGTIYYRASEICLLLTYFLCKHHKTVANKKLLCFLLHCPSYCKD